MLCHSMFNCVGSQFVASDLNNHCQRNLLYALAQEVLGVRFGHANGEVLHFSLDCALVAPW